MNNVACTVVSCIPGRIRLRGAMLRAPWFLTDGVHAIQKIDGVATVLANKKAASLTIVYDTAQVQDEVLLSKISQALGLPFTVARDSSSEMGAPPSTRSVAARRPRHKSSRRVVVNRYAKRIMLGTLGTSLALAAAGARSGHVLTGAMFVAALGVHLAVHRRHILR